MIPFLKSVAKAYSSRYGDLSEFCFLFPNKRSGTFFLKYLGEQAADDCPIIAPEVRTISDFVADLSGRVVASRLDLIFLLYECYREELGLDDSDDDVAFDSFRTWGETVLSDFNEVDLYLADPEEVFKNVKDYRDIASNFLTEEQKMVMTEYFGHTDFGDTSKFWKSFDTGSSGKLSGVKTKFQYLWRILAPLYRRLSKKLEERGLSTSGGVYRIALEKLREQGREVLPWKHMVMVGFNALSTVESSIFAELRDSEPYEGHESFADFFWDATGPILTGEVNSASKFVVSDIRHFPCPQWALPYLKECDNAKLPETLRICASPSNSIQVKIAGTMLAELRDRLSGDVFKDAKVAVVLPDENLLLPMLYSLPQGMGDVNLTMGYPFRLTSVVSFVSLLRRLFHNIRRNSGETAFYHRDLRSFLAHPFSHACFSTTAVNRTVGILNRYHKATMTLEELREVSPKMADMLSGMTPGLKGNDVAAYLDSVLALVAESISASGNGMIKSKLEISHIELYRDALRRFSDILDEYKVRMKTSTVFKLVDRILAGEKVGFEGEPLTGLQVMGTLETRSIDFDYIFILSANERVLPLRARTRSFIPDSLRHAFGMPPSNYAEGIFAYYFYRMISRAQEVTLLYDARSSSGMRTGSVSRYLLQLRHLYAKDKIKEIDWKFILSGRQPYDPSVEKVPEIQEKISNYFSGDNVKNLSATALNTYRECEVRFFYRYVMGLNTDPEPSEFIDSISVGNILHAFMLEIYLPEGKRKHYLPTPELITRRHIEELIGDEAGLWRRMTRIVNKLHYNRQGEDIDIPLTGASELVATNILRQVVSILNHDLIYTPFLIHGLEIDEKITVELPSGKTANFKFAIDRLDEVVIDGKRVLRIVDYKTGTIKLEAADMDDLFMGDYKGEQIFQLCIYGWLLRKRGYDKGFDTIRLEIYDANDIDSSKPNIPVIAGERYGNYLEIEDEFNDRLCNMLMSLIEKTRFDAPPTDDTCRMCPLKILCRR